MSDTPVTSPEQQPEAKEQSRGLPASFRKDRLLFQTFGQLAIADTPHEFAQIFNGFFKRPPGLFVFWPHKGLYFGSIKKKGDGPAIDVEKIGPFRIEVISYLKEIISPDITEYLFYLKIIPAAGGRPITAIATAKDLANLRGLKEFLLSRAKLTFEGGANAALALSSFITTAAAPEIRALTITGYDESTDAYIFPYWSVDRTGRITPPDERGLFKFGSDWIKPAANEKSIPPATAGRSITELYGLLAQAWGDKAAAILSWTVASWFAHQIRSTLGFFPFALLYGETQVGKSALVNIMNACQGFIGEGIGISTRNSQKGISRVIAGLSSCFISMLEDNDPDPKRKFDYSAILTWYNNNADLFINAAFSNDLRTRSAKFRATLLIVGNTPPLSSIAEKERACFFEFRQADIDETTLAAYRQLAAIPLPELACVIQQVLKKRKTIETEWPVQYSKALERLADIKNRRIQQNFAIIDAFHRVFCSVFGINHEITDFITANARKNVEIAASRPFDIADYFFEQLDMLDDEKAAGSVHIDDGKGRLYVHLAGAEQLLKNRGLQFCVTDVLGKALVRHPAFINKSRHWFPSDPTQTPEGPKKTQKRALVFDITKILPDSCQTDLDKKS